MRHRVVLQQCCHRTRPSKAHLLHCNDGFAVMVRTLLETDRLADRPTEAAAPLFATVQTQTSLSGPVQAFKSVAENRRMRANAKTVEDLAKCELEVAALADSIATQEEQVNLLSFLKPNHDLLTNKCATKTYLRVLGQEAVRAEARLAREQQDVQVSQVTRSASASKELREAELAQ